MHGGIYKVHSQLKKLKEKEIKAEIKLTEDALVSYWPIFPLTLVTVPEVFAKFNSAQSPARF